MSGSEENKENENERGLMVENIINKAIQFATEAHKGAIRKGSKLPYILHPLEAGVIVSSMTNDENVIAAAILHDVLEDTDVTYEELKKELKYCKAVVRTGEQTPYANIILKSGVVF